MSAEIQLRQGGGEDVGLLMEMFDGAVAWLAAQGRAGQWGVDPWSRDPVRTQRVRDMVAKGQLVIAEIDGDTAGALVLTETPDPHIPPAAERDLYIDLLITARRHTGKGVGSYLLDHARAEARRRGIGLLRVDCWAGGDGALVRYYVSQGFTPTQGFDANNWPGQVFEQRIAPDHQSDHR